MSRKSATIRNAVDTWVDSTKPSKARPAATALAVEANSALPFVYFANPVPRRAKVVSAVLRLRTKGSWGGASPTISVQRIGARYSNSKVTWQNRPGVAGTTATASKASSGDGDLWEINVAPLMQAVADGQPWYGFRIAGSNTTRRLFYSANSSKNRPELVVTWSEPPAAPTTLSPSGGQSVNAASPVVEGNYVDPSGTTRLAGMIVEVAADEAMTTPWSSGEVFAEGNTARLDLSTTTYPGLASGGVAYWRMKVRDEAGEWSAWSAVHSWTRTPKGTVTIASPSAASPTLADFTPPILWSTDFVQDKWQVLVTRLADGAEVFDSGEVAGTETEETVDARDGSAVLTIGEQYRVEVRAWDTTDRIGTVDDPAYSFATRDFTVEPGATVAPVNLRFEKTGPIPGLVVVFDRTEAPDAFTITRDGVPILSNVEPSDLTHDGLTWRYTVHNVRPNVPQRIGVSAIVNGVASPLVEADATVRVPGVWLLDLDGARSLFLANTGSSTYALGEESDVLVPLGSTRGIVITQGLRGYEGTISGVVLNEAGKTRDEWVDEVLLMRKEPGKVRRLVVGTEVLDVVAFNFNVRPTGDSAPGMRSVSFDFVQTGSQRIAGVV